MLLHNVLICGLLLLGLLSLAEARRVCKDHSRHCRQIGDKRPRFRCYRKSTQERCCATCRNFENPNNPDCLYGDKLAWCSSIGNRYSAVSCYTHEVECCETCGRLASDKIRDCPYGDREIWCPYFTKDRCKDQASRSSCCETCYHLLHGDTANTHGNKVTTTVSTTTLMHTTPLPKTNIEYDQNVTSASLNSSHHESPTEPNRASKATAQVITKVTENHTDATGYLIPNKGSDVPGNATEGTSSSSFGVSKVTEAMSTLTQNHSDISHFPTSEGINHSTSTDSTLGVSASATSTTGNPHSTVLPPWGIFSSTSGGRRNGTTVRTQPNDNNTRKEVTTSSPTVTYKPETGMLTSKTTLLTSSTSVSASSTSPSSRYSSHIPGTSPPLVTEIRIRLQDTPSPSTGRNGTHITGNHLPNFLPSLEDDEDYAQASGDDDITIDDVTEEHQHEGGGGHHHDGDHHHNGNHHGGHHHKKGHHKNGVTAEVPYRYIPAKREDYMFEDYKSSSSHIDRSWSQIIMIHGILLAWAIVGQTLYLRFT